MSETKEEIKKGEQETANEAVKAAPNKKKADRIAELEKSNAELEKAKAELEKAKTGLEASLAKEKDSYIRLLAEFETFRRRNAEEKLELVNSAASETIKGLLPVLDDCERAMEILSKSSDEAAKEGTALIYNKLMQYLNKKGLEKIEAMGVKFDVDFHEAVAQVPVQEEEKKGLVYDVVQTGYLFGGKVLRYAKVVAGIYVFLLIGGN